MSRLARILFVVLFLAPIVSTAQLREFEITPVQNSRIPVFRDHPDMAAVIVNSSMTNLRLESNLVVIATLGDASQGEYILIVRPVRQIVSVSSPGYQQGRVTITPTEARQVLYYRVEPKPEVATNIVPANFQITPTDALVRINGARVDASKPVSIEIGSHMLTVERQGYRTIEKEIRVSAEQNLFRETMVAIEPVPFTIKTQPAGATILLDGVQVGVTDRNGDLGLFRFTGTYELGVQLSGYLPETRNITLVESGVNAFTSTLVRNAGTLRVNVTPADATVLVNRQPVNIAQPLEHAPGMVRIEVSKEGHEPFAETVEILRSQTTTRTITLVAHVGGFQITPTPLQSIWSLTAANGQVAASGTGLARKTGIPVGSYTLSVRAAGYQDHSETVQIVRDQVLEKSIVLREGLPCGSNISDIDGNSYKTVQVGQQCWMAENLRTSKYRDGTPIPNVTENSQWGNLTTGAWVSFANQTANESRYGKLYNWYAAVDARNICPVGWSVPTDSEWNKLFNSRARSTDLFYNHLGGSRDPGGSFLLLGRLGYFWTSTESNPQNAWFWQFAVSNSDMTRRNYGKSYGFSIRCILD
jgi:hypothetical protein